MLKYTITLGIEKTIPIGSADEDVIGMTTHNKQEIGLKDLFCLGLCNNLMFNFKSKCYGKKGVIWQIKNIEDIKSAVRKQLVCEKKCLTLLA